MDGSDEEATGGVGKGGGKSRRELPAGAVAILKAWLLSPEHFTHPYPTPQDQIMLMEKTGIDKKQLKNWFTNARRRIWKPMLKKQLEAGKLAAGGAPGGGGGAVQGGMAVQLPAAARQQQQQAPQQEMYSNFQQAQIQSDAQYQSQQVQYQEQPVSVLFIIISRSCICVWVCLGACVQISLERILHWKRRRLANKTFHRVIHCCDSMKMIVSFHHYFCCHLSLFLFFY